MTENSTQPITASAETQQTAMPRPMTLHLIKQFARVYAPSLGGIILN